VQRSPHRIGGGPHRATDGPVGEPGTDKQRGEVERIRHGFQRCFRGQPFVRTTLVQELRQLVPSSVGQGIDDLDPCAFEFVVVVLSTGLGTHNHDPTHVSGGEIGCRLHDPRIVSFSEGDRATNRARSLFK